jgi:hypothetical protein
MDKNLASAVLLERCGCNNKALAAATKVLENDRADTAEVLWARRIVKSLGEVFLAQRFMDKAMECYQLLLKYPAPDVDATDAGVDACPEPEEVSPPFDSFGPRSVTLTTEVSEDVAEILEALKAVEGNESKDTAELLREAIYQLFLKYSDHKETRELLFSKIKTVVD